MECNQTGPWENYVLGLKDERYLWWGIELELYFCGNSAHCSQLHSFLLLCQEAQKWAGTLWFFPAVALVEARKSILSPGEEGVAELTFLGLIARGNTSYYL